MPGTSFSHDRQPGDTGLEGNRPWQQAGTTLSAATYHLVFVALLAHRAHLAHLVLILGLMLLNFWMVALSLLMLQTTT